MCCQLLALLADRPTNWLQRREQLNTINSLHFSPLSDHNFLSASRDGFIFFWDTRALPKSVGWLFAHTTKLNTATFSRCGNLVLSAGMHDIGCAKVSIPCWVGSFDCLDCLWPNSNLIWVHSQWQRTRLVCSFVGSEKIFVWKSNTVSPPPPPPPPFFFWRWTPSGHVWSS